LQLRECAVVSQRLGGCDFVRASQVERRVQEFRIGPEHVVHREEVGRVEQVGYFGDELDPDALLPIDEELFADPDVGRVEIVAASGVSRRLERPVIDAVSVVVAVAPDSDCDGMALRS
jgi:hypothetical protein